MDESIFAVSIVVFFRVMLLLLCSETAWRYARWWRHVYRDPDTQFLRDLLIGIAVAQSGFLLFTIYALCFSHVPRDDQNRLDLLLVGDSLLVVGTILHLRPAWRMSNKLISLVPIGILSRAVVAALIAAILIMRDLQ